jgi:hypothetical protein
VASVVAGRWRDGACRSVALAEHARELLVDYGPMSVKRCVKRSDIREPAGGCERGALGSVGRKHLRLLVVAVLKAVLDVAQEDVGVAQRRDRRLRQQATLGDDGKGRKRPADAQRRFAPAPYELQRLDDELDLADPARPELDVGPVVLPLALLGNLAVDVTQPSYASKSRYPRTRRVSPTRRARRGAIHQRAP